MPIYSVQNSYCLEKKILTVDKYFTYYKVRVGKMPGYLSTKYRMHLSSKKKYLLVPGVAAEM